MKCGASGATVHTMATAVLSDSPIGPFETCFTVSSDERERVALNHFGPTKPRKQAIQH